MSCGKLEINRLKSGLEEVTHPSPFSHGGGQSSCLLFLGHLLGSEDSLSFLETSVFFLTHEAHVKQLLHHNSC